jgi:acetoin utilization protein AcuB
MFMTADPVCASSQETLAQALKKMEQKRCRRLPVMEAAQLVGMVTLKQIVTVPEERRVSCPVREVMRPPAKTVSPDDPIESVAQQMRKLKIGSFPVVQRGKLVGIITESDIFEAFMMIMGCGTMGGRITFDLEKDSFELPQILELARRFDLDIVSIATYEAPGAKRRMVNLLVAGDRAEKFIDALWKSKYRVLKVLLGNETIQPP